MSLGPFVGPIYLGILVVDCIFFMFLEWFMPRENIDYVRMEWDLGRFRQVRATLYTGIHADRGPVMLASWREMANGGHSPTLPITLGRR